MRRRHRMRAAEGTADVALLLVLLASTIVPAILATGVPEWMTTGAGQVVLFGGAVLTAVAVWRLLLRAIRWCMSVGNAIRRVPHRLTRIETWIGIPEDWEPDAVEPDEA